MIDFSKRPYQPRAIEAIVPMRRGVVKAPAGSGKTIMGAAALLRWATPRARLARRPVRAAIVANTLEQCDQWQRAAAAFPELAKVAELTVTCYASGRNLAEFALVLADECHHIAAPEYCRMLEGHTGWRWGFSATPERADDRQALVFELLGPIVCEISQAEVRACGGITEGRVMIHTPNAPKEMEAAVAEQARGIFAERERKMARYLGRGWDAKEQMSRCVWQVAQELGIATNARRNACVLRLAREHDAAGDATIVLIGKVEHGEALAAEVPGALVVHSGMTRKATASPERPKGWSRREALAAFAAGEVRTIFATSLADEGLDVPRANVLINAAGGRSSAKTEQRAGRVLRAYRDKTHGTIHDFDDRHHYFLAAQSRRRISLYRELGYTIHFSDIYA